MPARDRSRPRRVVFAPCHAWRVIARVEPLTTTRRLSGPFDYRVDEPVQAGSLVRIPFGHQKLDGRGRRAHGDDRGPGREAGLDHVGARTDSIPADLVDLALWMAEEYCSTPARALALVSPPPGKAKLAFWAQATGEEGRVNDAPAGAARAPPRARRRRSERAAAAREARAGDDHAARRPPRAAHEPLARPCGRAHGGPDRRAGGDRGRPRRFAPVARRHRLGQDRGLPARGRRGARSAARA